MKIYLLLNCTCPNIKELSKTLKEKNFNKYLHISNCHTVATVWNIISGKRTTDLLDGGIAYKTHFKYGGNNTSSNNGNSPSYPFIKDTILYKLHKNNWKINMHNKQYFYTNIDKHDFAIKTSVSEKETSSSTKKMEQMLNDKNNKYKIIEKEKQFIKLFQKKKK